MQKAAKLLSFFRLVTVAGHCDIHSHVIPLQLTFGTLIVNWGQLNAKQLACEMLLDVALNRVYSCSPEIQTRTTRPQRSREDILSPSAEMLLG